MKNRFKITQSRNEPYFDAVVPKVLPMDTPQHIIIIHIEKIQLALFYLIKYL